MSSPVPKALSRIKQEGPGLWATIHHSALKKSTRDFATYMEFVVTMLPCEKCQKHLTIYLREDPPSKIVPIYDERKENNISAFKWTWIFHNSVNIRIGKPAIDWMTALLYWSEPPPCSADCVAKEEQS